VFSRCGKLVFAELKMPGRKPSDPQQSGLLSLSSLPAQFVEVYVWTPDNVPEIEFALGIKLAEPAPTSPATPEVEEPAGKREGFVAWLKTLDGEDRAIADSMWNEGYNSRVIRRAIEGEQAKRRGGR
jgi:hypothetical protein